MKSDHHKAEDLLNRALEIPMEQREAFLAGACGLDAELRATVGTLLRAHDEAGGFLPEAPTLAAAPKAEEMGHVIGRYKLREKIGEGGCGVVYVAEQEEPVRRRVALKVIKPGMDTRSVIARFAAERQALAMMDHPHIAKVLDAGSTDAGRPYFVMELVRGIRITEYCDKNKLATRERLDLFIRVCQAVQHAHQKGIIHRDLKPSNILVTLHDGVPAPKVIDFGIAKATEGRLTTQTVYTELHQFIGTPAYMSPEQAEMSGMDIDTRSDIYSLGVLLYELLAGRTPFEAKELIQCGIDEIRRTIREVEPPRPSARLSTLAHADQETVAKACGTEWRKLRTLLSGDLDWIVMKALEKDRTRRYETANALASDIWRHLSNEPVIARPPSAAYRFQKLVRRNKVAALSTAFVLMTLIAALAFSTSAFVRERKARLEAADAERAREQARQATEAETIRAETLSRFVVDFFDAALPSLETQGHSEAVRHLLDVADRLASSLSNAPMAEATMRLAIGNGYNNDLSKDLPAARSQYLLAEKRAIEAGSAGQHQANLARVRHLHSWMWELDGGHFNALGKLIEIGRACLRQKPADTKASAEALSGAALFQTYFASSVFDTYTGASAEAEALAREALEVASDDAAHRFSRMTALNIVASETTKRGATNEANHFGRRFLETVMQLESNTLDTQRDFQRSLGLLAGLGQYRPPKQLLEETLDRLPEGNTALAVVLRGNLGIATACSGDWKRGLELLHQTATNRACLIELWFEATCLAALAGDEELGRKFCSYGLARFAAGADPDSARVLAGGLLLGGSDKSVFPIIRELVDRSFTGPSWTRDGARIYLSLLEHRAGRDEEGLPVIQNFLRDAESDHRTIYREYYALALFLHAAIRMKLGQPATAVESYRAADVLHSPALRVPGTPYPDTPSGGRFASARAAELMRREAARLLAGHIPADQQLGPAR